MSGPVRAEKVAEARRLRGEGLLLREIAERMGAATSTVHAWLSDPDLSRQRARRLRYAGSCVDCGAATDGSNGPGKAPKRCRDCADCHQHETRIWTPETVVEAIRAFADRYGRPPTVRDWNVGLGSAEQRERFYRDGSWPHPSEARREFGSWNAALRAAGFEPTREFATPFRDDPTLLDDVAVEYLRGDSPVEIAARYGVSDSRIRQICKQLGIRRTLSEAGRLHWRRKRERAAA